MPIITRLKTLTNIESWREVMPGILLVGVIALAVRFISTQYGGPAMLYALLFGIAFNFLSEDPKCASGINFSSKTILRVGVALLGARITFSDVVSIGPATFFLVIAGVALTIITGWWIGKRFGLSTEHSVLSAGAVAICGASATLAIAAILPSQKDSDRNTILTVVGVTTLSTIAMILYPTIVQFLNLSEIGAGIFLGGTIHDVAQVVGAGYMISDAAGETATIVKLVRVACLVPAVLILSIVFQSKRIQSDASVQPGSQFALPGFLVVFILIVTLNSFSVFSESVLLLMQTISSWCILAAVAALGVKTSLQDIIKVGPSPLAAMVMQTLFLAVFIGIGLILIR